jgi:hypothetical protein
MVKRNWQNWALCICTAAAIAGCQEPQKMDMSAMKPPERPRELDSLDAWAGNWTMTGEGKMGDMTMKMSGSSTISWECDKRVMIARTEADCTGMGPDPMKESAVEIYTWNPKTKKFNTHYFNNMGVESHGDMTYDAATKTYHITGKGPDPMSGKTMHFEGDAKLVDSSTVDWTWCMWDDWKIKKTGEGKGTMKRK